MYVKRADGKSWNLPKKFRKTLVECPRLAKRAKDNPEWLRALRHLEISQKKFFFCYTIRPLPYLAGLSAVKCETEGRDLGESRA